MEDNRPDCQVLLNEDGSVDFDSLVNLPSDCKIPKTLKDIKIPLERESELVQHEVLKSLGISKPVQVSMDPGIQGVKMENHESSEANKIELPKSEVVKVEPQATVATVGVDQAVSQVKSLVPAGADASPGLLIGGAAMLAVVGAAIKFGPSMLKARAEKAEREHEAQMKKLEIEQKKTEQQDDQHKSCSVSRAALEAKVSTLMSKVEEFDSLVEKLKALKEVQKKCDDLEAKVETISGEVTKVGSESLKADSPAFAEFNERLEDLEKKSKPARATRSKK